MSEIVFVIEEGSRYSIQLANTRYSILQEEKLLRVFLAQKPAGLIVTGIDQTPESRSMMEATDCPVVQLMEIGENPVDMMIGLPVRTLLPSMINVGGDGGSAGGGGEGFSTPAACISISARAQACS